MNGISPFNYRKLTPEQESRGERVCTGIVIFLCIAISIGYAIYTAVKVHTTNLDILTGVACCLVAGIGINDFIDLIRGKGRYAKTSNS
jgi:hypothetical protein